MGHKLIKYSFHNRATNAPVNNMVFFFCRQKVGIMQNKRKVDIIQNKKQPFNFILTINDQQYI